jgi:hypothetical protein
MATLMELSKQYSREVYDHVLAEFGGDDVPVLAGRQSQGDVRIAPVDATSSVRVKKDAKWTPVGAKGIDVVRPANGGHTHTLTAPAGAAMWTTDVTDSDDLAVGVVRVEDGNEAWLMHQEHGATGIAPGNYVIRRQREQAEIQRLVAD